VTQVMTIAWACETVDRNTVTGITGNNCVQALAYYQIVNILN